MAAKAPAGMSMAAIAVVENFMAEQGLRVEVSWYESSEVGWCRKEYLGRPHFIPHMPDCFLLGSVATAFLVCWKSHGGKESPTPMPASKSNYTHFGTYSP